MRASEIEIGEVYMVKVSGTVRPVQVLGTITSSHGRTQWQCRNVVTGRSVLVRGAARFRCPATIPATDLLDE